MAIKFLTRCLGCFILLCPTCFGWAATPLPKGNEFLYVARTDDGTYTLVSRNPWDYNHPDRFNFLRIDSLGAVVSEQNRSLGFANKRYLDARAARISFYRNKFSESKSQKDSVANLEELYQELSCFHPFKRRNTVPLGSNWYSIGNYDMVQERVSELNTVYLTKFDADFSHRLWQRRFEDTYMDSQHKLYGFKNSLFDISSAYPFKFEVFDASGQLTKKRSIERGKVIPEFVTKTFDRVLCSSHRLGEDQVAVAVQKISYNPDKHNTDPPSDDRFICFRFDASGDLVSEVEAPLGTNRSTWVIGSFGLRNLSSIFFGYYSEPYENIFERYKERHWYTISNVSKDGELRWMRYLKPFEGMSYYDTTTFLYGYFYLETDGYILLYINRKLLKINSYTGELIFESTLKYKSIEFIDYVGGRILFCCEDQDGQQYVDSITDPAELILTE